MPDMDLDRLATASRGDDKPIKNSVLVENYRLGMYSNLTLVCGVEEFKVHRNFMSAGSSFFAAALNGNFMEARTGRMELKEDDPEAMKRMISFIYRRDYNDFQTNSDCQPNCVPKLEGWHARNEFCGEKGKAVEAELFKTLWEGNEATGFAKTSGIPDAFSEPDFTGPSSLIKDLVQEKLINNIAVYAIADKYEVKGLKGTASMHFETLIQCRRFWPFNDFAAILEKVFDSVPPEHNLHASGEGLWKIIARLCIQHIEEVVQDEKCCTILSQAQGFGLDVLRMAKHMIIDQKFQIRQFWSMSEYLRNEKSILEWRLARVKSGHKDEWEDGSY